MCSGKYSVFTNHFVNTEQEGSDQLIRTASDELTDEEIIKLIEKHKKTEAPRLKNLEKYYNSEHAILDKSVDEEKPDNRLVNSYPRYIVDMHVGYLVGNPISYSAAEVEEVNETLNGNTNGQGDPEGLLNELVGIYKYNDEQSVNGELATTAGKFGLSYELQYIDSLGNIRLKEISPLESFAVYDMTLENNMKAFVRYYEIDKEAYVEVYTGNEIIKYKYSDKLEELKRDPHVFGDVPVSVYENNKDRLGDYEHVIKLIDSYDRAQSDTMNDMDQFSDAYLALSGAADTELNDVSEMKRNRVLLLPDGASASWLTKQVNDTWVENFKNRTRQDIHKFSYTPDMSDSDFGGNLSGVSLSYKLLPMEQVRRNKERKFKVGIQRRIELICNYLNFLKKANYDYTSIDIQFNSTLPQNLLELSQIINNLNTLLSKETLLEQLPFIENAKEELEKKDEEDKSSVEDMDSYNGFFEQGQVDEQ